MLGSLRRSIMDVERPKRRHLLARLQRCIAPLAEHQRRAIGINGEPLHLGDEQHMVAAIMPGPRSAFEHGNGTGKQRRPAEARCEADALALLRAGTGKAVRHLALIVRQDTDRETRCLLPNGKAEGPPIDAEQDERRLERQRVERADRHPMIFACHSAGQDAHAGRKLAKGAAKLARIETNFSSIGHLAALRFASTTALSEISVKYHSINKNCQCPFGSSPSPRWPRG